LTLKNITLTKKKVLNRYYPEVGGNIDDLKNKFELNSYQKFRIKLRDGIRKSIQVVLCTIITRPFVGIFYFLNLF
jgi:hypothetical protein